MNLPDKGFLFHTRRFLVVLAVQLACALSVWAQEPSAYRVDNFDLANGVRIELPPTPVPSTMGKKPRRTRLTRMTSLNYSPTRISSLPPAGTNMSNSLEGFTTGNVAVDTLIAESGQRNSVDPLLLYSIMHQESTFKAGAVSHKGARGLMQLMPFTARRFGVTSIFDPRQNIEGGARYMRFLLDLFGGNVELALAGYNAGEGAVMKYGYRIPPYRETQEYVRRITKRYSLMRDPFAARFANSVSHEQLAAARQKEAVPLTIYEQSVFAVRLPDGRLQLISQ